MLSRRLVPLSALAVAVAVAAGAFGAHGLESRIDEKALEIWSVAGESHPNMSIALNNLGNLSNREGRFQDAQLSCEQAVAIDVDRHGDEFHGNRR